MTRKCFAAIKSGQENMSQIEKIAEEVLHKPTTAYSAIKQIMALAGRWNKDFGDVDPAWQPQEKDAPRQSARRADNANKAQAKALGAYIA